MRKLITSRFWVNWAPVNSVVIILKIGIVVYVVVALNKCPIHFFLCIIFQSDNFTVRWYFGRPKFLFKEDTTTQQIPPEHYFGNKCVSATTMHIFEKQAWISIHIALLKIFFYFTMCSQENTKMVCTIVNLVWVKYGTRWYVHECPLLIPFKLSFAQTITKTCYLNQIQRNLLFESNSKNRNCTLNNLS